MQIDYNLVEMTLKEGDSKLCNLYCNVSDWDRASVVIRSLIRLANLRFGKSYSIEGDRKKIKEE